MLSAARCRRAASDSGSRTDHRDRGVEPPAEIRELWDHYVRFRVMTPDHPDYQATITAIFDIFSKGLYVIGTIGLPPQPLLLDKDLRNGPKEGENWSWTYRQWVQFLPEQFYFDR